MVLSAGLDILKERILNILHLSIVELRLLGCSARSLATLPTELSRLTLLGLFSLFLKLCFLSMKANILVK